MSVAYKYVAEATVLGFFSRRTNEEREELLRVLAALAESPHQRGAWIGRTPAGREVSSKRFGRWLVTYWADDAVCELRIVALERVFA